MADKITLYCTSVSGSKEVKKKQQRIELVLTGKKIDFQKVDISLVEGTKEKMRELAGDPTLLPPQLFKGDAYLGNYDQFNEAIEDEKLNEFLKL